jgi:ubiquinone/menaquinone biosynthesis C-methylase UbiE
VVNHGREIATVSDQGRQISTTACASPECRYVFDNAGPQTSTRFSALAAIYDPGTVRHLSDLGIASGWRCLEVGGGGGSIVNWLCDQVGPEGKVVATDIDTRFLEVLDKANLDVRRHNIVSDPLPEAAFDLVHIRLVLIHIPERETAVERLITALKPGGWILAEEFDCTSLAPEPAVNTGETSFKTFGVMHRVMTDRGVDLRYGRVVARRLQALGLTNVTAEGRMFMWRGRSAAAEMYRANIEQLRREIIETKLVTAEEVEHDLLQLNREDTVFPSPIMWAVRGQRPGR